jgi:hypothetical protein
MKFANIDEAIMEAAKKAVPQKAVKAAPKMPTKTAPKKAEVAKGKKAPVAPAKKPAAPKKAEAPAAPKKKEVAPAPAPAKKVEKKKPAAAKPAPQKKKEEPKKQPEQKPAPSAGSAEKPKFAPRWLEKKRGIGDRLKSAWKSFTAKPGADLGKAGTSYKSVFHEIQKLMEELQLVEAMLREQSLNESYDASTVNNLHTHRNAIRGVLVEQMIREELYKHNVTVAELTKQERAALMETVNVRANSVWEQLTEMKFSDWESVIARANQGEHPIDMVPKEEPKSDEEEMKESYTLEEWMGQLQEAGYDISELSPELKARYMDAAKAQVSQNITRVGATPSGSPSSGTQRVTAGGPSQATMNAQRAKTDAKRIKGMSSALGSMNKQLQQRYDNPQGKTDAEKAAYQKSAADKFDRAEDNLSKAKEYAKWQSPTAESTISENTVSRLQELAGVKSLNS